MSGLAKARTWSTNGTANRSANTEGQSNGKGNGNGNGNENAREHRAPRKISRPLPPPPSPPSFSTDTATATSIETHEKTSIDHHGGLLPKDGKVEGATEPVLAAPSFLQPRIAAVLGVSRRWHPVLFSLRLLSIVPAICLGFPLAIRFLLMVHEYATSEATPGPSGRTSAGDGEDRLLLTETLLAVIWCGCSGYLSFFFTDCLMSRWLINYTPSATAFRLVSVSALNGYLQSWTLHLSGSSQDPFLLLPTWITITSTLTLVYHITYRKINIHKETSTSISVFSMASYFSMVALLVQQHWIRPWLELPFVALGCRVLKGGGEVVVTVARYANITVEH